mgnify:CR=1 FL=1
MKRFRYKKIAALLVCLLVIFGVWGKYNYFDSTRNPGMKLGVSFDPEYAGSLHLDPAVAFSNLLNDWKFKYFRLPLHWDKVESARGKFDFSEMDYYVNEAGKSGAKVILAIGNKTPRWPECHRPEWAVSLSPAELNTALESYLLASVEHYKNNPAVEIWQVENEPFFAFGDCKHITSAELRREIALVKQADSVHPVLVADSGELALWNTTARAGDLFGMTMYRVVWNKYLGYWNYDWLPAAFYRLKLWLVDRSPQSSFIVELQAEPWALDKPLEQMSIEDQKKSMDLMRLKNNIEYARRVGAPRAYLWGGEWWSWLKEKGYNEIPDFVATLNIRN